MKIEFTPREETEARRQLKKSRDNYNQWRNKSREGRTLRVLLFSMAGGKCPRCQIDMILSFNNEINQLPNSATLDHIEPISETLLHNKHNLEIMCKKCNMAKGNK